jgi:hypothetical protein
MRNAQAKLTKLTMIGKVKNPSFKVTEVSNLPVHYFTWKGA